MHIVLAISMVPLLLVFFQQASVIAPLANTLAVPYVGMIVVPVALTGTLLFSISETVGVWLLQIAASLMDLVWPWLNALAGLEHALWQQHQPVAWTLVPALFGLAICFMPRGIPGRWLALLLILPLIVIEPQRPGWGDARVTLLDVGQGLAVVIQTGQGVVLYDTGMAWQSGGSIAQQVITPFLQSRGITRIDRLVISHSDLDHSGGLDALEQDFDIGHTIVGEPLADTVAWRCNAGPGWWQGAVHFEMLHPPARHETTGNDASCVLRVSAGPHGLLLTGDIEAAAERELVQRQARLGADVVVVPHHGSMTSSSVPFIDSVHPDIAIVSSAYANRWGFPKEAVVERWQASGAEVLNTARHGAVYLRTCAADGVVEMRREREERRRFWHAD